MCTKPILSTDELTEFLAGKRVYVSSSEPANLTCMSTSPVSVITGAATGIGFAIASKLLSEGHSLVLNDLNAEALSSCIDQLNNQYRNAQIESVCGDAGSLSVIDTILDVAMSRFQRVDNAVANAGTTTFGNFLDYTPEQLEQLLALNIQGSFFLAQRTAKILIENRQPGRVVLMSSVTGFQYHPDLAAYGMTKAALRMLARSLGAELAPHGITVNCIAPGATSTERTEEDPDYNQTWAGLTPTGRASTPADIAATASFLLSAGAAQITGQTIVVDGGWTLTSPVND